MAQLVFRDDSKSHCGVVLFPVGSDVHFSRLKKLIEKLVADSALRKQYYRDLRFPLERYYSDYECFAEEASDGWLHAGRSLAFVLTRDNMIRTQVSLDKQEYALARREAKSLGISVAEFVRRAIRERLPAMEDAPWMRYAGLVESGNPRSSQSIDEVVYGSKD